MLTPRQITTIVTATASIIAMHTGVTIDTSESPKSNRRSIQIEWNATAEALESSISYKPPADLDAPQTSRGTGSRGCNDSVPVALTLLVPSDHIGLSASGHPSFFWHLSEPTSAKVEFALAEPGVPTPIFTKQMQTSQAGIIELEMPQELPELKAGKKYRWSVSVVCNENRRSSDVFAGAWIERVSEPEAIASEVSDPNNERQRALVFAQKGLWYDALNAISQAYEANPNDGSIARDRFLLLEQVGLTEVVEQEQQRMRTNP